MPRFIGIDPGGTYSQSDYTGIVSILADRTKAHIEHAIQTHDPIPDIATQIKRMDGKYVLCEINGIGRQFRYKLYKQGIITIPVTTVSQCTNPTARQCVKSDMVYTVRNAIYDNTLIIYSKHKELIKQIKEIRRFESGAIKADRNRHDDIFMAMIIAYNGIRQWRSEID